MSDALPTSNLANLIEDLALAQRVQEKRFAAIVRFVRRCEASGPANSAPGECRVIRERVHTPSGRLIIKTRRICD